jgi:hypothetical protein
MLPEKGNILAPEVAAEKYRSLPVQGAVPFPECLSKSLSML